MSTVKPTTVPSKRLAASLTAASTTFQLNNILGWNGADLTSADFGSVGYIVLRNENGTQMELASFDPTTIANSSITFLKRGLNFTGDLTTESSDRKLTWIKGETIVELGSDTPQLFQWLKEYIDAASIAGAVNSTTSVKGIVELATSSEIDSDTAAGSTGAGIAVTPDQLVLSKYGTRLPTANEKSAIAGNNGSPSSSNKLVTQTGLQNAAETYAVDTGSANAMAVTLSPVPASYATGMRIRVKAANSNTGDTTINVNSLGVKTIKKDATRTLSSGDILSGQIVELVYDGTYFQLISSIASVPRIIYKTSTSVSSSATTETDLVSTTVPGGTLGTTGLIHFKFYTSISFTEDLTLKVYYGSSSVSVAITGVNNSDANGIFEGYIMANASTSAQKFNSLLETSESGTEGTNASTTVQLTKIHYITTGTYAIDSTANQTLKLTAQFAGNDGNQLITVYFAIIEFLG